MEIALHVYKWLDPPTPPHPTPLFFEVMLVRSASNAGRARESDDGKESNVVKRVMQVRRLLLVRRVRLEGGHTLKCSKKEMHVCCNFCCSDLSSLKTLWVWLFPQRYAQRQTRVCMQGVQANNVWKVLLTDKDLKISFTSLKIL